MAEAMTRPDIDVEHDIHDLIAYYPPLARDRHHLHVEVHDGVVKLSGYLKAGITHRYLLSKLFEISGIQGIDHSQLYDDDDIWLNVGKFVPVGVFANLEYGIVKLTGTLPQGITTESLVRQIATVPGVHRVVTALN